MSMYVSSINKQGHDGCGCVRWPAVAALLTAPQFRNAVLKYNYFHFRPFHMFI